MAQHEHIAEEALEQYSLGTLPDREAEPLEEHLLICPRCQDRLGEVDAFVNATREAAVRLQMEPPSRSEELWAALWRLTRQPAMVGGAVSLVLLGLALYPLLRVRVGVTGTQAVMIALEATRGGGPLAGTPAPAGRPLKLVMDRTGLPERRVYRVEIVASNGEPVLRADARVEQGHLALVATRLAPGGYWVRIEDPGYAANVYREFALVVQ